MRGREGRKHTRCSHASSANDNRRCDVDKKPALGKGLSALIPDATASDQPRTSLDVDIDVLEANRYQPRTQYDDQRLAELAQSIATNGVIQPIIVRRLPADAGFARP